MCEYTRRHRHTNCTVAGKHLIPGHTYGREPHKAVVDGVVAELWPDYADVDAVQGPVVLQAPQLHDEPVHTVVAAVDDQIRHDGRVCR